MAKNPTKARTAAATPNEAAASDTASNAAFAERQAKRKAEGAEAETALAQEEGRMPSSGAVTNPAPATVMESASGAFIEQEIKDAIPTDHPSVDNNPRSGTSAVQNGADFNDPNRRDPSDPKFAGQGLDLSVYGDGAKPE